MTYRSLTYDSDIRPVPGDALCTDAGTYYRVVSCRPVERRTRAYDGPRWSLFVEVTDAGGVADAPTIHPLHWYPRRRTA